jgi:hypothetical protein
MRARKERQAKYVLGTTVAGGRSKGGSKPVLLSGGASCPAERESGCLNNRVLEASLPRG